VEIRGGAKMGDFDSFWIESVYGNSHVYGHEEATKL
jgi:hypothetical protein